MAGMMQSAGFGWQAGSQIAGGIAANRAANFSATQADQAAGQQQAAGQRGAEAADRNTALLTSRAQAVTAASGGSATDPTVVNIVDRIAGEGAYRSQLALYQGNDAARSLQMRAVAERFQGAQAERAGFTNAVGTALKGGYTMYDKYNKSAKIPGTTPGGSAEPYFDDAGWGMT